VIVTLTPNPSLDRTLEIERLERGEVVRSRASRAEPGGKGVNVSRALLNNHHRTRAVLPIGGPEGDHIATLLDALGLDMSAVPIDAPIRTNISLIEPDGTVTKVNAPGPRLTADEVDALHKATIASLDGASWVAACGALPPGAPADMYARLTREVHAAGVCIAVDTSGAPLAAVIDAGPDVVKPNADELAALTGAHLATLGDVVSAALEVRRAGAIAVLVSLGRHGAVLVDGDGAVHAESPPVTAKSNVGAGDATLAGLLAGGGAGPDALRTAVAWGTAAVRLPGSAMPGPVDIDVAAVHIHDINPDRQLGE
jgi:1-phosphofructokinase